MSTDLKAMLADIKRAIADDEFSPSKWESEFLDSVTELINFELGLSDKQDEVFEKLWSKATGQDGGDEDDPDEDDFV
jgi:hypothetical protein